MTSASKIETQIYQGQFGEFTITEGDRLGVIIYRAGLTIAAISFALGTSLVISSEANAVNLQLLTPLFGLFSLGLAISLATIHIYLIPLHRLLQAFWLIGSISALVFAYQSSDPLALFIYDRPLSILGIGFTFAALTGIYFKEAFCFNRLETKFLTPLVPFLLLGHLFNLIPPGAEKALLSIWAILFIIFAARKFWQEIPQDIGDKSVFTYLKQQQQKS